MTHPAPSTGHPPADVLVVGTAGHIDHGKTSLVHALTGTHLDRLPEEQARGITIALGFTNRRLPSGRVASFVDVPGHERLVRTMIAGATGLDAVVLCVSAVEGVMPQTREHLEILQLLGVSQGLVALTMCDLVDDELAELAELDIEDAVQGTFLEGAPVLRTAAGPSPHGIDALVAALDHLEPVSHAADGPLRLPIDRAFVRHGFGTVVTGTLRSGTVQDGDEVELQPGGQRARVRGLQVHGEGVSQSRAGLRTALNLASVERDDLTRGHVVCRPGTLQPTQVIDLRLRTLADAPPIAAGARVRLLLGTSETLAVFAPVAADGDDPTSAPPDPWPPGTHGLVQLRTDAPVVALPGDRVVVRRESPVTTLGGGTVLDAWAPRVRGRTRSRHARELRALDSGDHLVLLDRAGHLGLSAEALALRGIAPADTAELDEGRYVHPQHLARLADTLVEALDAWHVAHPLADGAPRRDLHGAALAHLPSAAFDALVSHLCHQGELVVDGPRLRRTGFSVSLNSEQQAFVDTLLQELQEAGAAAPRFKDVLPRDPDLVSLLLGRGTLVRYGDRVTSDRVLQRVYAEVEAFLNENGRMMPTDLKALYGLSRKHAIPLLEWLDSSRLTVRDGDARVLRGL